MRKYEGYEQAEAFTGEFETLEPGGYICKILKVAVEEKSYGELMKIAFDIAEGPHKDFYKRRFERNKQSNPDAKWPGMYYQTIKPNDLRYFKGFITNIENSNPGFKWDWDEKKLVGKLFGGVFGQEEYENSNGEIKLATKCMYVRTVEQVKNGIEIPDIKRLNNSNSSASNSGYTSMDNDDELPF